MIKCEILTLAQNKNTIYVDTGCLYVFTLMLFYRYFFYDIFIVFLGHLLLQIGHRPGLPKSCLVSN